MRQNEKDNILFPLLLFFITIISRIPFTSRYLYNMDSVQFALALDKYDITVHYPHPPGYFLYIMLGRVLNLFIEDANSLFVLISIIFSGLAIVAIYYLGKELFNRRVGLIAAAIAITSPNFWFYGEVALNYSVEAFFSTLVALFCWRIYRGEHKHVWITAIALSIAGGIRQNTMIFLLPLWLLSMRRVPVRKIILSVSLLGICFLLWFIPMVFMTGGYSAYRGAFRELWTFHIGTLTVFEKGLESFLQFLSNIIRFTLYGVGAGIFIIGIAIYSLIKNKRVKSIDKNKLLFFLFWIVPTLSFYLVIYYSIGNPGYVLLFLPVLFILIALSIDYLSVEFRKIKNKDITKLLASALVIINACIFLFWIYPVSFGEVSYEEIRRHDRNVSVLIAAVRPFDPEKTAIFVPANSYYSYRHIMYYLPEYRVYTMDLQHSSRGDLRAVFWGMNRETFISNEIVLPKNIHTFVIISYDYAEDNFTIQGTSIKKLLPSDIYIISGPIALIKDLFPALKIHQ